MLKTFKKAISIIVLLSFIMSFMPLGIMAETSENTVSNNMKLKNWVATRNNGSRPGPTVYGTTGHYGYCIRKDSNTNDCRAYTQLDLNGYEEIIENENTKVSVTFHSYSSGDAYILKNFDVYAMNDSVDFYATEYDSAAEPKYDGDAGIRMLFSEAVAAGLHNYDEKGVLLASRSDAAAITYTFDASAESLSSMLKTGADNSMVTFSIRPTSGSCYIFPTRSESIVTITYNKDEIDNQAYVDSLAQELSWEYFSDQDINAVENNLTLPSTYRGADISWSSSNPAVVSDNGVVTISGPAKEAVLTASISYQGIDADAQIGTASKSFTLTTLGETPLSVQVPFTNYGHARNDKETSQKYSVNSSYSSIHYITTGGIWYAYAQLDLSQYEEIIRNPNTSFELGVVSGNGFTSYAYDYKVYLAADSTDGYKYDEIYFDTAKELGLFSTDRPLLCERVDSAASGNGQLVTMEASRENLLSVLNESGTNGLVTLFFAPGESDKASVFRINDSRGGLFISYYESEQDDAQHMEDIQSEMLWDNLTSDSAAAVENNLPTYFKGASLSWSDDAGVAASNGKLTRSRESAVDASLTADISYKGYTGQKSYDITYAMYLPTVLKIDKSQVTYITGSSPDSAVGVYDKSYNNHRNHTTGIYNDDDRMSFIKWDLSGYEEILDAAVNVEISWTTFINADGEYIYNAGDGTTFTVLNNLNDSWTTADLTYNDAVNTGMYSDPGIYSVNGIIINKYENRISGEGLADAFRTALDQNPENGIVVVRSTSESYNLSVYRSSGNEYELEITYYTDDVKSDEDFAAEKINNMAWSSVSTQNIDCVVSDIDLPADFHGAELTWSSSDETAITSSGEVTIGETEKTVTLTASGENASKSFVVTVPAIDAATTARFFKENGVRCPIDYAGAYVYSNEAISGTPDVLIAIYKGDELISLTVRENVAVNKGFNAFVSNSLYFDATDAKIKAIVVDDIETLKPLATVK